MKPTKFYCWKCGKQELDKESKYRIVVNTFLGSKSIRFQCIEHPIKKFGTIRRWNYNTEGWDVSRQQRIYRVIQTGR